MYLHLGADTIVPFSSIIGIFDLENTSQSKITRTFLSETERAKRVYNVSEELPRSFIVCQSGEKQSVYISQISPQTLKRRVEHSLTEPKEELRG